MLKYSSRILFLCCFALSWAHDYVPGEPQKCPILLRGGDLHTVTQGVLKNTDLLFEQGRITQIGQNLKTPEGTKIIDITGKQVYPGLIAAFSVLGLLEIGAVRATSDIEEVGGITPEVQSYVAYNPDSEIIPTIRSNGITTVLLVPQGDSLSGRSSLMNLDGWTIEDAMEKRNVGLHLTWPPISPQKYWWIEKTEEEKNQENAKKLKVVTQTFDLAKRYFQAKQANPLLDKDSRWEAMLPIFTQEMPVFIYAEDLRQIEMAIDFAQEYKIRMILVGGYDSWKIASRLKENKIPVILRRALSLPRSEDDDYDLPYHLPKLLTDAGVQYCISFAGDDGPPWWDIRNLPFMAGYAVAFGLTPEEALTAITLAPAQILGVERDLGSLDVGKKATLVISEGDILDPITHQICLEFIEGRKVDLNNRQKELYQKYQQKKSD
ncbi:MAG: amidohydrolase family protein [Planctomycetota bacterium]